MSFLAGNTNAMPSDKNRVLGIDDARTTTHQEARPLPYFAGLQKLGVTWLAPGLNIISKSSGGGKKGGSAGKKFFADLIAAVCLGPVDRLDSIWMDNEQVWSGPITRGSEDFVSLTTLRGTARFYWGTETQTTDPILGASPPPIGKVARTATNHPPYRGQCYVVFEQLHLGRGRPAAPTVEIICGRWPTPAGFTGTAFIDTDVNPMVVVLEWLTNKRFGLGLASTDYDLASLNAVAASLLDNSSGAFGLSPLVVQLQPARQLFIDLLQYFDGFLRTVAGALQFGLNAPPADLNAVPVLDESTLVEEPDLQPDGWVKTFNQTYVVYSNRARLFKESTAGWLDSGNLQITGEPRAQTVQRPYITKALIARLCAAAQGQVAGIPALPGTLRVKRSAAISLLPGDVVHLNYADYGQQILLRILGKTISAADGATIDLQVTEDRSTLASVLFLSPDEAWAQEQDLESDPIPTDESAIIELPRGLLGNYTNTLAPLAPRADSTTDSFNVLRSKSPTGNYKQLGSGDVFAVFGALAQDYIADTLVIDDAVGMLVDVSPIDEDLLVSQDEPTAALETLLAFIDNEIVSIRDVTPVTGDRFRLTGVVRARFDTVRAVHHTGTPVWFIAAADLLDLTSNAFANNSVHYFKLQPAIAGAGLDLSNIDPITHTVTARSRRPLPPINVAINGNFVLFAWATGADILIAWRLTSWDRPRFGDWWTMWGNAYDDTHVGTRIEIWATSGSPTNPERVIKVTDGIESHAYTNAQLVSDFGSEPAQFQAKIWSNRNGYLSAREQDFTVNKL